MAPRIDQPDRNELDPDVAAALSLAVTPHGETAATMSVLAHQGALLTPFLGWAAALHLEGVLSSRNHELLALRASWNCRSEFEWVEHCEYARKAGMSEAELERIADGPDAGWEPIEAALLRAADELHEDSNISEATWNVLAEHFSEAELVEAVFIVGQYTMLSMVANAARVETPPGRGTLPSPRG